MKRTLIASCVVLSLAGCGSAELVTVGLAAAGGIISSMTASPDYELYANKCREIVQDARAAAEEEGKTLRKVAEDKAMGSQVLLYMAMKPKTDVFAKCALMMPKGFLASLAESGNILNFVATVYGINRDGINQRKTLEANKEISLAGMEHQQEMTALQNALLRQLSNQNIQAFEAAKPPVVAQ